MPHLTQANTHDIYSGALPHLHHWATCTTTRQVGDPTSDTDPLTDWAVEVTEDEASADDAPAGHWTVDHDSVLAAMQRIVDERDSIQLADSITDQIARVLAAEDNETAADEVCQLDVIAFDAIMQVATLQQVVYG